MSSLRTSADSDAEPEQMETKEMKLAEQRGGGVKIEGVTTDRSLGRAPACAPQVLAGGGSSQGLASGEPSSVFGRHRPSFLMERRYRRGSYVKPAGDAT